MHLTTKYEQERASASEIVKLKKSFETLEQLQQDRLAEIKKTDLGIIQAVRNQRDQEVGELKAALVGGSWVCCLTNLTTLTHNRLHSNQHNAEW